MKTNRLAPTKGLLSSNDFHQLLRRRTVRNAREIDRRITKGRSVQEIAVLACDSAGFARQTHEYGILQFLAVMVQCYDRVIPFIKKHHGHCVSHNIDHVLAIFPSAADAVACAVDMQRWLARYNEDKRELEQFSIRIGVNWGKVLRLKDNIYGDKVNVAAKIGEDMAGKDEILVTKDASKRLKGRFSCKYLRAEQIGGRTFELYRVAY